MSPNRPFKKLTLCIAALGSSLIALGSAHAGDLSFAFQSHELQTFGGAEAVYKRLERKAHLACTRIGPQSIVEKRAGQACEAKSIEEIVGQIGNSRLDSVHARARESTRYAAR